MSFMRFSLGLGVTHTFSGLEVLGWGPRLNLNFFWEAWETIFFGNLNSRSFVCLQTSKPLNIFHLKLNFPSHLIYFIYLLIVKISNSDFV